MDTAAGILLVTGVLTGTLALVINTMPAMVLPDPWCPCDKLPPGWRRVVYVLSALMLLQWGAALVLYYL